MDPDVVVIGSGAGGMTAAVALARAGRKVVVLEQHYLPGGWTHSFTLDGYRFSPGVHYIGELHPGGAMRSLFEGLGLSDDLAFCELNPQGFDHYFVGDDRFDVPKGFDRYLAALLRRFPHERAGLLRYYAILEKVLVELRSVDTVLEFPAVLTVPFRAPTLIRWGFQRLGALLDQTIRDPLLRAFLTAQAGNYAMPPSDVSLPTHIAIHAHYYEGGYYPRGGARAIPAAMIKELRRHGGAIHVRTAARSIRVERRRAIGVETEDGRFFPAKWVISDADPYLMYTKLLPPEHRGLRQRMAERMRYTIASLIAFSAVDADLRGAGFDSGNYWWYASRDIDGIYRRAQRALPAAGIETMFVSIPTLKDPSYRPHGHHTIEAFTFVPYDAFARWADVPPEARDPEYARLKAALGERVTDALDRLIPGTRRHLKFQSIGTPLTNDFFVATRRGAIYGTAKLPWQIGPLSYATRTPIANVVNCGASILSHGVAGAAFSGLYAASLVLGAKRPVDLLGAPTGRLKIYPSEHPEAWTTQASAGAPEASVADV